MLNLLKYSLTFMLLPLYLACETSFEDIPANTVGPSEQQIEYQKMEFIGFIHFTVNTFTDQEWGYGSESPDIFNPSALDVTQWVRAAKEAGMKQLIITAKHHDGFCLWPSKYTEHSVKNSQWKNGKGDILRELSDACREYGLKFGVYLSPWDRNHPNYAQPEYITYFRNQLEELLTKYGEISEIWFDGANGGSGYYGGANETRHIDRKTYYNWHETWALVKKLQPNILIFSDAGPDIRWIGNERGIAAETNWSMINNEGIVVGGSDIAYLNTGDPEGKNWVVGECDVSIRPGWFYHASQDSLVKTPQQLVDLYYKSVGRNATFLLNIPPDHRGLFHENDVAALKEFRSILDETFRSDLAKGKSVTASNYRSNSAKFAANNITDADLDSYWATDDGIGEAHLEVNLENEVVFDRISLQEPIRLGQRISAFVIEAKIKDNWVEIAQGTTIGYKRLMRISPVRASRLRIYIKDANNIPALSNFALFKASSREKM